MAKDPSQGVLAFPPPHRGRRLHNEAHKTLVRIMSLCGDHDIVSRSVRSADGSGNVESCEEKDVDGRTYNRADSARQDGEYPECSNVLEDSLANQQLEGALYDENRGSRNEQSTVNEIGHMLSFDEHDNCSTRQVDKMVGENRAVITENINESLVSVQGHNISTETAVIKEDPSILVTILRQLDLAFEVMPTDCLELAEDDLSKSKSASKVLATPSDLGLSKLAGCQGCTPGNSLVLCTPVSSDSSKQNLSSLGNSQTPEVKRNAKSVGRSSSVSSANPSDLSRKVNSGRDSSCTSSNVIDDKQIGIPRTPLMAPKGINFLSFGVSPMDEPNLKKPISSGLALKLSTLSSSLNARRTEDSSQCINAGPSDVMAKDSAPEMVESANENIKVTPQPEVKSPRIALSTDTPIAGDASSNFAARNLASSSWICNKVPISAIASVQSSNFLTADPVKGTSASTQWAMPLIFSGNAAIKLFGGNHSIFPGVNGKTSREVSPDNSAKSLSILDFLASIGKKR